MTMQQEVDAIADDLVANHWTSIMTGDLGALRAALAKAYEAGLNKVATPASSEPDPKFGPRQLLKLWNASAPPEIKRLYKIVGNRERLARGRLAEYGYDDWMAIIAEIAACPFLRGDNDRPPEKGGPWKVDFDWLLRLGNIEKVLEGKYRGLGLKERKQAKSNLVGSVLADGKDLYG